MKIFRSLIISTFAGLLSYGLYSCSNEEKENEFAGPVTGLETSADFLKLADNGNDIAGELSISANVPEVKLVWNTDSFCNLDTAKTSLTLHNGRATLPIKWDKALSGEEFGPEGVAYKAGVKIIAGDYSKYVPLIWAEEIDTAKVMESIHPASRVVNDALPRVAQINLTPTTVNMNYETGGAMYVTLTDASFAIFDLSSFTPEMHVDMSLIPTYINQSQLITFKWTSAGAPSQSFTASFTVITEGISKSGVVTYAATTPPQPQYSVNFSATAGGTVTPTTGSGNLNQAVSSTAYANAGYTFDGWYDDNTKVSGNATYVVTLSPATNGKNYQAKFVPVANNNLHFKILGKGTISYGTNTIQGTGGSVTLPGGMTTFTPNANYLLNARFASWHRGADHTAPQITATYGSEYVDAYGVLHVDPELHKGATYTVVFNNLGATRNRIYVDPRLNLNRNSFAGNQTWTPAGGSSPDFHLHSPTVGTPGYIAGQQGLTLVLNCNTNNVLGYLYMIIVPDGDKELAVDGTPFGPGYGGRCDFWLFNFYFTRGTQGIKGINNWEWTHDLYLVIRDRPGVLSKAEIQQMIGHINIE